MTLGENIYRYRTEKKWSQGDLADALNVSRQSISKWENNMAAPDLDKLIKLHTIFEVTLDELILGEKPTPVEEVEIPAPVPTPPTPAPAPVATPISVSPFSTRQIVGFALLLFGLVMFLLSIFLGDSLYFGEEVGELASLMIILISLFILAPYNTIVISACGIVYVVYCVICFGIMNETSIANSIFLVLASFLILAWFIICGLHANRTQKGADEEDQK